MELFIVEGKLRTDSGIWIYLNAKKGNFDQIENLINLSTEYFNKEKTSPSQAFDNYDFSIATKALVIADNTINTTIKHINQADDNGSKKSSSQVIRHQIAQMASEIECYKQFVNSLSNRLKLTENLDKEILMAKLTSMQLMDKVVSQCFEIFGNYNDLKDHPLDEVFHTSKKIQISNNKRELHENIAKFIIED